MAGYLIKVANDEAKAKSVGYSRSLAGPKGRPGYNEEYK